MYHESTGLLSVYQHLDSHSVEVGQSVVKGQEIAVSGNSGRYRDETTEQYEGYGHHLHFELIPVSSAPKSIPFDTITDNTDFNKKYGGQSALSTRGLVRDDGALWYQITATMDPATGITRTFSLKYEAAKMTVTNLMPEGPYMLTPACAGGMMLDAGADGVRLPDSAGDRPL